MHVNAHFHIFSRFSLVKRIHFHTFPTFVCCLDQGWHILVTQTGYTEHGIHLPIPGAKKNWMETSSLSEKVNHVDPYWGKL